MSLLVQTISPQFSVPNSSSAFEFYAFRFKFHRFYRFLPNYNQSRAAIAQ